MEQYLTETITSPSHESGAVTAEYAVATVAGVGIAGLLITLLKSNLVQTFLTDLIKGVFDVGFRGLTSSG